MGKYDDMAQEVVKAYLRLQELDKNNDLFKFLERADDKGIKYDSRYRQEYLDRFAGEKKHSHIEILRNYRKALLEAIASFE